MSLDKRPPESEVAMRLTTLSEVEDVEQDGELKPKPLSFRKSSERGKARVVGNEMSKEFFGARTGWASEESAVPRVSKLRISLRSYGDGGSFEGTAWVSQEAEESEDGEDDDGGSDENEYGDRREQSLAEKKADAYQMLIGEASSVMNSRNKSRINARAGSRMPKVTRNRESTHTTCTKWSDFM
jgi:hypothetical protein